MGELNDYELAEGEAEDTTALVVVVHLDAEITSKMVNRCSSPLINPKLNSPTHITLIQAVLKRHFLSALYIF